MPWMLFIITCLIIPQNIVTNWIEELNLPPSIIEYLVINNKQLADKCENSLQCSFDLLSKKCFGYEQNCGKNFTISKEFEVPKCRKNLNPSVKEKFYNQADFGYISTKLLKHSICSSSSKSLSSLHCSDQLIHCVGRNIFFDFSNLKIKSSKRYRTDVIGTGQIGGNCEVFNQKILEENLNHRGYLTSWSDELRHFSHHNNFEIDRNHCDVIFEKPTIMMKLDASVNMYHHFCDFLNLYASLHLNQSFNQDIYIIWYDTHSGGFIDKYYGITWKAFSNHDPIELKDLDQKRVCFKNLLLPLLARQRSGLYYNTPLVEGCEGSALVKTFREFILHRLGIAPSKPDLEQIRIVILQRSTPFRKITNIRKLQQSVSRLENVRVKVVDYNEKYPFIDQLNTTSQSDILIGMHGAGLTHLLFLPDWAAVFEIYNCDDEGCYLDLARLRGIKYFTWKKEKIHLLKESDDGKHPISGNKHKKFANYHIDEDEFTNIVQKIKSVVDFTVCFEIFSPNIAVFIEVFYNILSNFFYNFIYFSGFNIPRFSIFKFIVSNVIITIIIYSTLIIINSEIIIFLSISVVHFLKGVLYIVKVVRCLSCIFSMTLKLFIIKSIFITYLFDHFFRIVIIISLFYPILDNNSFINRTTFFIAEIIYTFVIVLFFFMYRSYNFRLFKRRRKSEQKNVCSKKSEPSGHIFENKPEELMIPCENELNTISETESITEVKDEDPAGKCVISTISETVQIQEKNEQNNIQIRRHSNKISDQNV